MDRDLIKKSVSTTGPDFQIYRAVDNMVDLIKTLLKETRVNDCDKDKLRVINDITDVEISLETIKFIYDCAGAVEAMKEMRQQNMQAAWDMRNFVERVKTK